MPNRARPPKVRTEGPVTWSGNGSHSATHGGIIRPERETLGGRCTRWRCSAAKVKNDVAPRRNDGGAALAARTIPPAGPRTIPGARTVLLRVRCGHPTAQFSRPRTGRGEAGPLRAAPRNTTGPFLGPGRARIPGALARLGRRKRGPRVGPRAGPRFGRARRGKQRLARRATTAPRHRDTRVGGEARVAEALGRPREASWGTPCAASAQQAAASAPKRKGDGGMLGPLCGSVSGGPLRAGKIACSLTCAARRRHNLPQHRGPASGRAGDIYWGLLARWRASDSWSHNNNTFT